MILKLRSLVIVSFMVMLFSGVVYGDEIRMPAEAPGVYEPDTMDQVTPNLLIGGIGQVSKDPDDNPNYEEFAYQIGARYIPTYYGGNDISEVMKAASASSDPDDETYENGLKSIKSQKYDTIVAYSGGTVTAVTALANKNGVECNTLILISPMAAHPQKLEMLATGAKAMTDSANAWSSFYNQIEVILKEGKVKNIIVIQSEEDQLKAGNLYQYRFSKDMFPDTEINSKITVDTVKLDLPTTQTGDENAESTTPISYTGEQAHKDLFFEYAKKSLQTYDGRINYVPSPASEIAPVAADVYSIGTPRSSTQGTSQTEVVPALVAADVLSLGIPQNAEEWNSRGIALLNRGNYKEAQRAFIESAFLDDNPVAWKNYWDIYWNHGQEDLIAEKIKEQKAIQSSETIPIAADENSIGTQQSDIKFIKTSTPILSNLNIGQGTTETASQSIDTKFGDTQLSVTQPVDPQPDLAFGDNQQPATQTTKPSFGDNADVVSLGMSPEELSANHAWKGNYIAPAPFQKISGTQFEDWPSLGVSNYPNNSINITSSPIPYSQPAPQPTVVQAASQASTTGSENSVVGTWNIVWNTPTPAGTVSLTVTFSDDGTFSMPSMKRGTLTWEGCSGRWTKNGDNVRWECGTTTWEGTIQTNSMNGMAHGASWSAEGAGR